MQHGGLEPRKTEFEAGPVEHGSRKDERAGATVRRDPCQLGAARIRQTEQLRGLVERLPGRIVAGLTQHPVGADALHLDQHRVATGDQQRHMRKRRRVALQQRGQQMTLQVMHPERRHPPGKGQRARQGRAGEQGPDQARPGGIGNAGQFLRRRGGSGQHFAQQRQQSLDMVAGGQFGHHPAIDPVQLDLAEYRVREQAALAVEHGRSAFVTGGFEGKNFHGRKFSGG